ncbi:MAG: TrkA C-terminal domain-containing protein, partial [Deinococcales bacterium]
LGENHGVVEIDAETALCGKLSELRLPHRFGVQVIAVNRGGHLEISPRADYTLQRGDRIVMIGSNDAITRLREYLSK